MRTVWPCRLSSLQSARSSSSTTCAPPLPRSFITNLSTKTFPTKIFQGLIFWVVMLLRAILPLDKNGILSRIDQAFDYIPTRRDRNKLHSNSLEGYPPCNQGPQASRARRGEIYPNQILNPKTCLPLKNENLARGWGKNISRLTHLHAYSLVALYPVSRTIFVFFWPQPREHIVQEGATAYQNKDAMATQPRVTVCVCVCV